MRVETKRRRSKQPPKAHNRKVTVRETRPRDFHRLRPLADDEVVGLRLLPNVGLFIQYRNTSLSRNRANVNGQMNTPNRPG